MAIATPKNLQMTVCFSTGDHGISTTKGWHLETAGIWGLQLGYIVILGWLFRSFGHIIGTSSEGRSPKHWGGADRMTRKGKSSQKRPDHSGLGIIAICPDS